MVIRPGEGREWIHEVGWSIATEWVGDIQHSRRASRRGGDGGLPVISQAIGGTERGIGTLVVIERVVVGNIHQSEGAADAGVRQHLRRPCQADSGQEYVITAVPATGGNAGVARIDQA